MRRAGIRHLPVFTSGRLLGLVTMRDLLLASVEEKGQEVRLMRAYIAGRVGPSGQSTIVPSMAREDARCP